MLRPADVILAIFLVCCSITSTESVVDGWTEPSGTIIQKEGSTVRILCGVDGHKYTAERLGFYYSNGTAIDDTFIRKVNRSTIEMVLRNVPEQDSTLVCKLDGQHGISYNDIKIGHEPDPITGLKCLSDNWHDMNCSFVKPPNPATVQYSLTYRLAGGSSQFYLCEQPEMKNSVTFSCYVQSKVYRRTSPMFEFILVSNNSLGSKQQVIPINNYASVVPRPPENLNGLKIMDNGVILGWNVNNKLLVFPEPFDFEFLIISPTECDAKPKSLKFWNRSSTHNDLPVNFTQHIDLGFANTWYDISIRMKISTAPDTDEMWSKANASTLQVKTTARAPDHPPEIDSGSFNIGPGGDVYLYWKHVSKCFQNGANYSYLVSSSKKVPERPSKLLPHVAFYMKEQVDLDRDTTFTIRSTNAMGHSKAASHLVIPGHTRRLPGPTKIKKILSNGSYQLLWSPPQKREDEITSYTVFWCVSKSELPNSCESSIDFEHRMPHQTFFNYTSSQTVNFAVSANSATSTSGMIWARCTTANSNEIGKIKTIWIPRLASTEIEVKWKLECTDSGIVAGYQLEYCPSREPKTLECMEPQKKLNITGGLDDPKHTLTGLMPYTTYKIIIRMFSNSTMGPASDPLANTTLEAGELFNRNILKPLYSNILSSRQRRPKYEDLLLVTLATPALSCTGTRRNSRTEFCCSTKFGQIRPSTRSSSKRKRLKSTMRTSPA